MVRTRLTPSPHADLHLGHAWTAYHNWATAQRGGGQFFLVLDDETLRVQGFLLGDSAPDLPLLARHYVEDLTWLGCKPDGVYWTSEFAETRREGLAELGLREPTQDGLADWGCLYGVDVPSADIRWPLGSEGISTWYILNTMAQDRALHTTHLYRGRELEYQWPLYVWFANQLGWRIPAQCYLPEVWREGAAQKESKTAGSVTVRQLREAGYEPQAILETLLQLEHLRRERDGWRLVIPQGVLTPATVATLAYERKGPYQI